MNVVDSSAWLEYFANVRNLRGLCVHPSPPVRSRFLVHQPREAAIFSNTGLVTGYWVAKAG